MAKGERPMPWFPLPREHSHSGTSVPPGGQALFSPHQPLVGDPCEPTNNTEERVGRWLKSQAVVLGLPASPVLDSWAGSGRGGC